jgi:hypothetical protein
MPDISVLELLAYSLWLIRDLVVLIAVFLAVLGLFSRRDRQNAALAWILGALATIASAAIGQKNSLLNIPVGLIVLGLVVAAVLILFATRQAGQKRGFRFSRRGPTSSPACTYRLHDGLLTAAENSFYQVLLQTTGGRATICPKVRLGDILDAEAGAQTRIGKSRIDRKHVDFLLCEPTTLQPLVAIELDDSSHHRPDRQARDRFVDEAFSSAKLPLVHVRAQRQYDATTLATTLSPYLGGAVTAVNSVKEAPETPDNKPLCPKCGAPMVVRVAQRGTHQGKSFYACSHYPDCRSILRIDQ